MNDVESSLEEQGSGEKLSPIQLKYIVRMLENQNYNIRLISRNLGISRSLLCKIISMDNGKYES